MYGPELVGAFSEFKQLWDPDGLMNPGKVVDPYPLDTNIRYLGLTERAGLRPTGYSFADDAGSAVARVPPLCRRRPLPARRRCHHVPLVPSDA